MTRVATSPLGYAPLRISEAAVSTGALTQVTATTYDLPARSFASGLGFFRLSHTNGVLAALVWGNTFPDTTFPTDAYCSSDGGRTWERKTQTFGGEFRAQAAGNGRWVALTGNSRMGQATAVSTDGLNWTLNATALPSAQFWYGCTFGDGLFRAGSFAGQTATSPDGITWTTRASVSTGNAENCMYGNGVWVVAGRNAAPRFSTNDGVTWQTPSGISGTNFPANCNNLLGGFAGNEFWLFEVGAPANTSPWWRSFDGQVWRRNSSSSSTSYGVGPLWPYTEYVAGMYVGRQVSLDGESFLPYQGPETNDSSFSSGTSFDGGACWLNVATQTAIVVRVS